MASYIDQFNANALLVIKKPPASAPTIRPFKSATENNFLEDRFVCFAYRYQYANGEFSATSQFSAPAFTAQSFRFNVDSYLNEGMLNSSNAVEISFNTGDSLVKSIEILFKEFNDPTIKVVEKLNKLNLGLADNQVSTFIFDSQKIFTVLPENEILRLYDNVPLLAQAQTLMGNRLIFGNYVEGYNLVDRFNQPIQFNFSTALVSTDIENLDFTPTFDSAGFDIGSVYTVVDNGKLSVELDPQTLIVGSSLTFDLQIEHFSFAGQTPFPTETTTSASLGFTYNITQNFNSVSEMAQSSDFVSKIGTSTNIQTVANACNGATFTDVFNCIIPNQLDAYLKKASGISAVDQPIQIFSSPNNNTLSLQLLAMQYVDDLASPTQTFYEYYTITSATVTYTSATNNFSLHSNRGYEIGIVYMDEYNRSSTALVSPNNTVHVNCSDAINKNNIQVTIPGGLTTPPQIAPFWATRYKFVIKADKDTYNTIYTNVYFEDPDSNLTYFLLEGQNANLIEEGDRLIVKSDSNGPRENCTFTTVLEKQVQSANFLTIPNPLDPTTNLKIPSGVYMKLNPTNFATNNKEDLGGNIVQYPEETAKVDRAGRFPCVSFPITVPNPGGTGSSANALYTIPEGSRVYFRYVGNRRGASSNREQHFFEFPVGRSDEFIASTDYADFIAFFEGENIIDSLNNNSFSCNGWPRNTCNASQGVTTNQYDNTLFTNANDPVTESNRSGVFPNSQINGGQFVNFWRFAKNTTTGEQFLMATGPVAFSRTSKGRASASLHIEVIRAENNIVFESIPSDSLPDVWYECDESFAIDDQGQHSGNVQNQNINFQNSAQPITPQDAIIDTSFSNCIAFGNGVESYKIRDAVGGKQINFGNRVSTTSSQIYKRAHRFADLTYSGVFNDESNVNKLNEFNLGLLNFKPLEDLYGPIQKLHGRRTDILTLQEDKISYVLQGKDLLTDASGGGALTSVPTVLGTQVARDEEFGISSNPESFAVYGNNKFFTDAKRAAVIKLTGGDTGPELLTVISESGMRSWFRDFFVNCIGNQKLGGFDPYMNEYVLASNSEQVTTFTNCLPCGTTENVLVNPGEETIYCVNITQEVGTVAINYVIPDSEEDNIITETDTPSAGTGLVEVISEVGLDIRTEATNSGVGYTIEAIYNNVSFSTGLVFVSGTLEFNKNNVDVREVTLKVTTSSTVSDTIQITTECPVQNTLNIYSIAITSNNEAGQFIHNQYSWQDSTFSSPLHSNQITFSSDTSSDPIVSQYSLVTGIIGSGAIPSEGANVKIISNKLSNDNYTFNTSTNEFRFLRSSTKYNNNSVEINSLISSSALASPIVTSGDLNYAEFTMPNNLGDNLYLIWDYRSPTPLFLNYDSTSARNACCGTVPVGPVFDCNTQTGYSGGESFPTTQIINLGAATGVVTLTFNAGGVPDKFIVEFDGSEVINTGYRGDSQFQGALNSALAERGLPAETIQGTGSGTATFTKSTSTTTATLKVFGPMPGTQWIATLSCPV